MSILDPDIIDNAQNVAKEIVRYQQRVSDRISHSTNALGLIDKVFKIQTWLKNHWMFPDQFIENEPDTLQFYFNLKDKYPEQYYKLCNIPQPKSHYSIFWYYKKRDDKGHILPFSQLWSMTIEMPRCDVCVNNVNNFEIRGYETDNLIGYTRWSGKFTLLLENVNEIPDYIGHWKNDMFIWEIPVEHIYIRNCPDFPKELLKLYYIDSFEELDYWEYRYE